MTDPTRCQALVRLDGKVSRALQSAKGIKFSSADLEMLASIGVIGALSEAKASALEEEARNRQSRARLSEDGRRAPASSAATSDPSAVDVSPVDAMPPADVSSGRLRAQRLFG